MIYIFDFDRTLLNTEKFTKELCKIFNIKKGEFNQHIEKFFRKTKIHYSPEKHIKLLNKIGKFKDKAEERRAEELYAKLLKKFDKMLFPEVKKILSAMKKHKNKMFLITCGSPTAQKRKVEATGIKKYFKKIIYTKKEKAKHAFLKKLTKIKEQFLIINDKPTEALAMKKVLGKNAEIFLVDSPHAKRENHNLKIYKSIKHLKKYI